ncbi:MAG: rhodanese-like domain-containing protein [Bacteroidota bacterium]|nr:rhodanese-like domain-containing protein [Bacteroidota bacterium]
MNNKKILLILSFVSLIIAFSGCTKYNFKFQKSVDDSFESAKKVELLPLDKLVEVVIIADTNNYQFVDIRTPYQYSNGYILNALSLPIKSLYAENCEVFCNNDKIFLIYGENSTQARLAYSYLSQLGIKNIYALGGGYDYIEENIIKQFGVRSNSYDNEIAKYDYAKIIAQTSGSSAINSNSSSGAAPPIPIIKRKKKDGGVGGCE